MSLQKKFGEIPPIIKGVITVFVFRVLAPWWQSEESNRANSLSPLSPDTSSHHISIKNLQSFRSYIERKGNIRTAEGGRRSQVEKHKASPQLTLAGMLNKQIIMSS
jgi:hypothetical protein